MASVCFYFQVHQPFRLRHYTIFEQNDSYFDEYKNAAICRKVANKCYLPANRLLLKLIRKHQGRFKVAFSITGVALEQFEKYCPEVMSTFDALARTGCVEFLAETYYHSLSFLYSRNEFAEQVKKHSDTIESLFGQRPRIFRNTELIYNDELAKEIESMGCFDAVLTEGADHILGDRTPDFVYKPAGCENLKLLLKNYSLSDDIAFRFSNKQWPEYPLYAGKFANWVNAVNGNGNIINLFMDYETFGEHQWADTGIFDFMAHLPEQIMQHPDNDFKTPSEVVDSYHDMGEVSVPHVISWADEARDLSAWLGNAMQSNALHEAYRLENLVKLTGDKELLEDWRKLQTSDHFYYMCTKYFNDGDVHKYFSPYDSPYDSYINFMNVLHSLKARCETGDDADKKTAIAG
ncbi:Glycosyl hydrolase family 57 [Anaerohalosphaera lusitana]|uniref:Glycosyl hydrolase family 57 n=1 Tax=Anaerohalosphaera lusitana TaxID=1936003 RepID=A0A1U9NKX9_9BACT|nr:glycoside hydrolase family 57 protein [Anaerohalosphaera lusitana]AQT68591.1 Glycosyl hydrolase family 57 [Anaerohalosphaera lusitana]